MDDGTNEDGGEDELDDALVDTAMQQDNLSDQLGGEVFVGGASDGIAENFASEYGMN